MLLGGLLGLHCGSFSESEWVVAAGFVSGAVVGLWLATAGSHESQAMDNAV